MGFSAKELWSIFKRDGGQTKADLREHAPVHDSGLVQMTNVKMLASVGGHHEDGSRWELVGGEYYNVSTHLADKLIINGWAMGTLSRNWSQDEIDEELSKQIPITMGGGDVG